MNALGIFVALLVIVASIGFWAISIWAAFTYLPVWAGVLVCIVCALYVGNGLLTLLMELD